jgi:hypothetical protein
MLQVPPGPLSSREHIVFYLILILVLLGTKVRLFLVLNMLTSIQRLFITRICSWLGWFLQQLQLGSAKFCLTELQLLITGSTSRRVS